MRVRRHRDGKCCVTTKDMKMRTVLPVIAILIGGFASASELPPDGPMYGGTPLNVWVKKLQYCDIQGSSFRPAAEVVEAIQSIGPAAVPWLVKWMRLTATRPHTFPNPVSPVDPELDSAPTHYEVAMAFRVLGTEGRSAVPELARLISGADDKPVEYDAFIDSISSLAFLGPDAVPVLLRQVFAITNGDIPLKGLVIDRLGWMGTNGEAAIPSLITWAGDTNASVRQSAVGSLAAIGRKPELVLPVLITASHDPDDTVRLQAATGLGNFGKQEKSAITPLIKLLKDPEPNVRRLAILKLGKLAEDRDLVVPPLIRQLKDKDVYVRWTVVTVLGDLGDGRAFESLKKARQDTDPTVRKAALEALTKLDRSN
jgi:HEAT repeat protein